MKEKEREIRDRDSHEDIDSGRWRDKQRSKEIER